MHIFLVLTAPKFDHEHVFKCQKIALPNTIFMILKKWRNVFLNAKKSFGALNKIIGREEKIPRSRTKTGQNWKYDHL